MTPPEVHLRKNPDGTELYAVVIEGREDEREGGRVAWVVWGKDSAGRKYLWCQRHSKRDCVDALAVQQRFNLDVEG